MTRSVGDFQCIDTDVILHGDVIKTNRCIVLAESMGCQV